MLRVGAGQPPQLLQLYEYELSPFCRRVREAITDLDLNVEIYPCPWGAKRTRAVMEVKYFEARPCVVFRTPNHNNIPQAGWLNHAPALPPDLHAARSSVSEFKAKWSTKGHKAIIVGRSQENAQMAKQIGDSATRTSSELHSAQPEPRR